MGKIDPMEFQSKSGKTLKIRIAEESDAGAILQHARSVMAEEIYTLSAPDELPNEDQEISWIRSMKENPASLLMVATRDEQIVGMLDFTSGRRKRIAHTGDFGMSVGHAHREDGIGAALLKALLEWVASRTDVEKVCLKVHATNLRARSLYKKFGFLEEGRLIRDLKYGPGEYVDSILMGKFVK